MSISVLNSYANPEVTMKSQAELFASDDRVRGLVSELAKIPQQGTSPQAALLSAPQNVALRAILRPAAEGRGFNGFVVLDTNFLVLTSARDQLIGMKSPPGYAPQFQACLLCWSRSPNSSRGERP